MVTGKTTSPASSRFVSIFFPDAPKKLAGDLNTLSRQFAAKAGDAVKDAGLKFEGAREKLAAVLSGANSRLQDKK